MSPQASVLLTGMTTPYPNEPKVASCGACERAYRRKGSLSLSLSFSLSPSLELQDSRSVVGAVLTKRAGRVSCAETLRGDAFPPKNRKRRRVSAVRGWRHMAVFIAGATMMGLLASYRFR